MSLKVAIFEDDIDVADLLKEMMETKDFDVVTFYSLKDMNWQDCDIILGDYRNKIVAFKTLQSECSKRNIPLVAISGADTDYLPQLLKPFSIEDLQSTILATLVSFKQNALKHREALRQNTNSSLFTKAS
jgi:DNA-binding NtrC family response regulator